MVEKIGERRILEQRRDDIEDQDERLMGTKREEDWVRS